MVIVFPRRMGHVCCTVDELPPDNPYGALQINSKSPTFVDNVTQQEELSESIKELCFTLGLSGTVNQRELATIIADTTHTNGPFPTLGFNTEQSLLTLYNAGNFSCSISFARLRSLICRHHTYCMLKQQPFTVSRAVELITTIMYHYSLTTNNQHWSTQSSVQQRIRKAFSLTGESYADLLKCQLNADVICTPCRYDEVFLTHTDVPMATQLWWPLQPRV